jgi:hypothetical protein
MSSPTMQVRLCACCAGTLAGLEMPLAQCEPSNTKSGRNPVNNSLRHQRDYYNT